MFAQGRHRRDLPFESSRQVVINDNSLELASQLGYRIQYPIPRELWARRCEPPVKNFLHLGRLLFYLHRVRVFYDL